MVAYKLDWHSYQKTILNDKYQSPIDMAFTYHEPQSWVFLGQPAWPASPSKAWSVLVRFPNPLAAGSEAGNLSRSTQIGKHDLVKPQILSLNNVLLNLTAYIGQCGQKRHKSQILMPDKWYQWTSSDTRKRTCILCLTLQFLRCFHSQLPCASQLAAAKDQSSVWHFHLRFGICDSYSKISSSLQLSLRNKGSLS